MTGYQTGQTTQTFSILMGDSQVPIAYVSKSIIKAILSWRRTTAKSEGAHGGCFTLLIAISPCVTTIRRISLMQSVKICYFHWMKPHGSAVLFTATVFISRGLNALIQHTSTNVRSSLIFAVAIPPFLDFSFRL